MNWFATWLMRLLHVPTEAPVPAEGTVNLTVRRPGINTFRLQLITWAIVELGGLLFILAVIQIPDIPLVPDFIERWIRMFMAPDFWINMLDKVPEPIERMLFIGPLFRIPNLSLYGYALQALLTLLTVLTKLKIRTSWFVVHDHGVRTRTGVFTVQEKNADFSRIQSLRLKSSLLQGFLGLADIELHTASASAGNNQNKEETTLAFRNIDNAREIYTLIQAQLLKTVEKQAIETPESEEAASETEDPALVAARALLAETQSLRAGFQDASPHKR